MNKLVPVLWNDGNAESVWWSPSEIVVSLSVSTV